MLEKEGELDKAIAIYESAPAEYQTEDWKKRLAYLKKLWTPVNDDHKAARKYLYDTFPGLTTDKLKEGIVEANKHFGVCKKAKDVFGPMRLRKATLEHVKRLTTEAEALNPAVNIDDEKPLEAIKELVPKLRAIVDEVGAYLEKEKS